MAIRKAERAAAAPAAASGGRTRDQIGSALWPAATPAQAKNSFHVTLHHLRRTLGHREWIVMDADRYRLAPELPVVFDAERFEHDARTLLRDDTIDAARLSATLTLERGDLFDGDALRHYDRLVSVLRDTFDSDPEPQTVELAEMIRQGPL